MMHRVSLLSFLFFLCEIESTDILRKCIKEIRYIERVINRETVKPKKQYYSTLIHMFFFSFFSKNHHKSSQRVQGHIISTQNCDISIRCNGIICFFLINYSSFRLLFFVIKYYTQNIYRWLIRFSISLFHEFTIIFSKRLFSLLSIFNSFNSISL